MPRTIRDKAEARERKRKATRTAGGLVSVVHGAAGGGLETGNVGAMLRLDDLPRRAGDDKSDKFPIMRPT